MIEHLRIRKHPDGYWLIYGQRNKRLGVIVQPVYLESLGLSPTTSAVREAVLELYPHLEVSELVRVVVD